MKKIYLSKEKFALVDDEDFEWLSKWNWYATERNGNWYATREVNLSIIPIRKRQRIYMHDEIMGTKSEQPEIDHKNNNGLDNRKENLRHATRVQNSINSRKRKNTTSKYKGVFYNKGKKGWDARISLNGVQKFLGRFQNEKEAARKYDEYATVDFGEFAKTNFRKPK